MIEIPESLTIARQLNEQVKGKRILEVEAAHTPHSFAWYSGEPVFYSKIMVGRIIGEAKGIGSMVEIALEEYCFIVGDGANLKYLTAREKLPQRYQTRITFEDGSHLVCTVQMYGAMFLVKSEEYDNPYYLVAKEKPQPGTEDFTYGYFRALFDEVSGSLSMKAFLATQQRIPGLGNGVLQDILLQAGMHPKRKIGTLTEAQRKRVYEAVTGVLGKMTVEGGRDTEKNLYGIPGGYQTMLSKKTVGKPCPYCAALIEKANYLGGTVYYCPVCQEL